MLVVYSQLTWNANRIPSGAIAETPLAFNRLCNQAKSVFVRIRGICRVLKTDLFSSLLIITAIETVFRVHTVRFRVGSEYLCFTG